MNLFEAIAATPKAPCDSCMWTSQCANYKFACAAYWCYVNEFSHFRKPRIPSKQWFDEAECELPSLRRAKRLMSADLGRLNDMTL